jgi:hypothetical protein
MRLSENASRKNGTLVNSETLARDRTLIDRKDARALINFVIVVIALIISTVFLVALAIGCISFCGSAV